MHVSLYDTIRDAILTCAEKLTNQLNLRNKQQKVEKKEFLKTKRKRTDKLRNIGKPCYRHTFSAAAAPHQSQYIVTHEAE